MDLQPRAGATQEVKREGWSTKPPERPRDQIILLGVSSTKGDCMPSAAETNGQPESEG